MRKELQEKSRLERDGPGMVSVVVTVVLAMATWVRAGAASRALISRLVLDFSLQRQKEH